MCIIIIQNYLVSIQKNISYNFRYFTQKYIRII
jgi:hypothetical protein